MKAAILQGPREFVVKEVAVPEIGENEVLVRTKICGVCTGELDMWEGKVKGLEFPRFIGHEVSGIVEGVGSQVTDYHVGDHITVWTESKGYAEFVAVSQDYLYKLKPDTPLEYALGEPIACAVNGVRKLNMDLNESVCLVGCGFMGLIMLQIFKISGAGLIIAVDTRDGMLNLAKQLGATQVFNPLKINVREKILELTRGEGVDIGVETGGNQKTLDLTTEIVRMEGKLEVFGFHQGEPRQVNLGYWNWMAFQLINGHSRSSHIYMEGMRLGLELLEMQKLNMEPLVTHHFSVEKINEAFKLATSKPDDFVKAVINF